MNSCRNKQWLLSAKAIHTGFNQRAASLQVLHHRPGKPQYTARYDCRFRRYDPHQTRPYLPAIVRVDQQFERQSNRRSDPRGFRVTKNVLHLIIVLVFSQNSVPDPRSADKFSKISVFDKGLVSRQLRGETDQTTAILAPKDIAPISCSPMQSNRRTQRTAMYPAVAIISCVDKSLMSQDANYECTNN